MVKKFLGDYPNLCAQVHPDSNSSVDLEQIIYGSNLKLWWKCPEGDDHIWQASVKSRVSAGRGCPFCVGTAVSRTTSLETFHPEIAREWHPSKNGLLKPSGKTRSEERLHAQKPLTIKLLEPEIPENYLIFTAGESHQIAGVLNDAQYGRFFYLQFKGIEGEADANQDRKISAGEVYAYVRESVGRFSAGARTPTMLGDESRWVLW